MSEYVCSDLHGQIELYHKIKRFLKPDDKVYCLGDSGDRGPEPWQTLKVCLTDPQFIYLKGNHDDMLVRAYREAIAYGDMRHWGGAQNLLAYNGGSDTLNQLLEEEDSDELMFKIDDCDLWASRVGADGRIQILCHAGFNPHWFSVDTTKSAGDLNLHHWVRVPAQHDINLPLGKIKIPTEDDLMWARDHFLKPWDVNLPNVIVIHGHTNTLYLRDQLSFMDETIEVEEDDDYIPGAQWYCDGHKCCIDNASYFTGKCVLMDLDTYEEHIFSV